MTSLTVVSSRAHPRSRGENFAGIAGFLFLAGSSPLTRGKQPGCEQRRRAMGLIPAHAGKTYDGLIPALRSGAHPRSRGENAQPFVPYENAGGSSPLTRGKPTRPESIRLDTRLIPAHAGKTQPRVRRCCRAWAHPRSRGENESVAYGIPPMLGSSPLTRGKLPVGCQRDSPTGLIPAHAGKTRGRDNRDDWVRAHPRSRGENSDPAYGRALSMGSSPLTRGKHLAVEIGLAACGLIPAHAGKTAPRRSRPLTKGAHPRSRGENP